MVKSSIKLLTCIFASLSFGMASVLMAEERVPFSEVLGRPASLFVFGKEGARNSFVEHLLENDRSGVISPKGFSLDPFEADVFVFLLEKWSDVKFAPWQEEMERFYEEVSAEEEAAVSVEIATTENSRNVLLVFYNLSSGGNVQTSCVAQAFLASLKTANPESVWAQPTCDPKLQ